MNNEIIEFDRTLFLALNSMHHAWMDIFFLIITQFGNAFVVAPILIGIVIFKIPRRYLRRVLLCGIIGMSMCGIINSQLKKTFKRLRPVAYFAYQYDQARQLEPNKIKQEVHSVGINYTSRSFPSGHTNTAFSAAVLSVMLFGRTFFPVFILASLVGYSRIYLGLHFPSDVAAGAFTGIVLMFLFCKIVRCERKYFLP